MRCCHTRGLRLTILSSLALSAFQLAAAQDAGEKAVLGVNMQKFQEREFQIGLLFGGL